MASSELRIILKLTDKASRPLKNATKSMTGFQKGAALAGGALIAAAGAAAAFALSAVKVAARVETLGVVTKVLGKNVGFTEKQIRKFEQGIVDQGIELGKARQSIAMMIQSNISLTKSTELATMAQNAAVIAGVDSSEAFNRLVRTIQTANVRMGRTLGLALNFGKAYDEAAQAVGRTAESLTEVEKAQIRTNHVLEQGTNIAGAYDMAMETAGKQITSLPRHITNLKVSIGEILLPVWARLVSGTNDWVSGLRNVIEAKKDLKKSLDRVTDSMFDEQAFIEANIDSGLSWTQVTKLLIEEKSKLARVMDAETARWEAMADSMEEVPTEVDIEVGITGQEAFSQDLETLEGVLSAWSRRAAGLALIRARVEMAADPLGGQQLAGGNGLQQQHGGTFTVPQGFPNDSFPVRASSGERVSVDNSERSFFSNSNVNINNGQDIDAFEEMLRTIQ